MKSKIKKSSTGVKAAVSPKAFAPGLAALREAYAAMLSALLVRFLPRIEAGEFLDMGDEYMQVRPSDVPRTVSAADIWAAGCKPGHVELPPGIWLLGVALREFAQDERTQRAVFAVSTHEWARDYIDDSFAAGECLAYDVRDIYRRQQRAARSH